MWQASRHSTASSEDPLSAPRSRGHPGLTLAFTLAIVPPTLLAWNVPPSATLLNQALAILGWGLVATVVGWWASRQGGAATAAPAAPRPDGAATAPSTRVRWAIPAVLGVTLVTAFHAAMRLGLPWSLAWSAAGVLAAALVAYTSGLATGASAAPGVSDTERTGRAHGASSLALDAFQAFCIAWLVAGLLSLVVAGVQFFAPQWADGDWIARTGLAGRAVGNLRQPNHLSTLLLWSAVAAWWLVEARTLPRLVGWACLALLVAGVVMTASRTGVVGVGLLALWGLLERRAAWPSRLVLVAMPLLYAAVWFGLAAWAHAGGHVFGAEGRLTAEGDLSSSRFAIWSNTLALIETHPWAGVGFGRFNFVWSLTPFPGRPTAFFDHTHNLPLQLIVELGWPLGLALCALLLWALWHAWRGSLRRVGEDVVEGHARRAAFVMVLLMTLHSQLEYPLWYAHFLLPTVWVFGWTLASAAANASRHAGLRVVPPTRQAAATLPFGAWALSLAGAGVIAGGVWLLADYQRVVAIFAPAADASPLAQRIEEGRRSVFFAHHAAYASATTAEHPGEFIEDFASASFYLLDTRLMMAWARALAERGDTERARHLAARLREFGNPQSAEFFAACDATKGAAARSRPFQCTPPTRPMDERDFP